MSLPNILYIICHDLGRCLNAYGRAPVRSPNLDRLAGEGMLFTNHFCTSPYCSPSRGAITTGRYPHSNGLMGLVNLGWELPAEEVTTPELLKRAGYETWLFGGQHERRNAEALGYDHVDISAHRSSYAERVASFLSLNPREPFYLNYFIFEPHRPFLKEGGPGPAYGVPDYALYDDPGDSVWVPPYLPNNEIVRKEMAGFQKLVETMDQHVGRVIEALDGSGLADNTLVVFTTDHGIDMPRAKGTLYDPGIEAALIMCWPARIPAGAVSDQLASNVDLLPTFLDIAGLKTPENVQGRSLVPVLDNQVHEHRAEVFAELGARDPMRCIRTRTHKLIFNVMSHRRIGIPAISRMDLVHTVPELLTARRPLAELYDLVKDPLETKSLWNDPSPHIGPSRMS